MKDFIQKITSETMESVANQESSDSCDLNSYFENKLNNENNSSKQSIDHDVLLKTLDQHQIPFYFGTFIKSINAIRFFINTETVDFPINWGVFKKCKIQTNDKNFSLAIKIESQNDDFLLVSALSALGAALDSLLFYIRNENIVLAFFNSSQKPILNLIEKEHFVQNENINFDFKSAA